MQVGSHPHVVRNGEMLRCTVCHRTWQSDEQDDMEATTCNPEPAERTARRVMGAIGDDDFLTRLQVALELTPRQLAKALDIPFRDVLDRHGKRGSLSEVDADPFWILLSQYVDRKIGEYIGVREELQRKLSVERRRRAEQRRRVTER